MAGSATSDSRLGITLQGYDQVIALSQANINESLEYHFTAKSELCKFEATLKSGSKESIKGTLKPPTIELVDVENADQALYCLDFKDGEYSYWDFEGDEPRKAKMPVKGWRLAFYIDFAMKKMATVPKDIADQIQLPGSYSVDQLLVNFGTADVMNFNWGKSKVTGFSKTEEDAAKDTMTLFVTKWLNSLKNVDNSGSHNVLGYAVKIDPGEGKSLENVLKELPKSTPSFPPTAVRLQTINHRPGGDHNRSSTDNDHNAFLFTEMTEGRPMISKDLQWSGDWFYESIGGSLVMSKGIFWDKFLAKKLQMANKQAVEGANRIAKKAAFPDMGNRYDWIISDSDTVGEAAWTNNGLESHYEWKNSKYNEWEQEIDGPNMIWMFNVDTSIKHVLKPLVGQGKAVLSRELSLAAKLTMKLWGISKDISSAEIKTNASARVTNYIQFRSVDGEGDLSVDVTTEQNDVNADVNASFKGIFEALTKIPLIGPKLDEWVRDMAKTKQLEDSLKAVVQNQITATVNIENQIQNALNGQGRFVFPGGGTFDMKDPLFNKVGDLMIGLTYRKGDAA